MRRKMADRRVRPRFEIVGNLWGTFDAVITLRLRNVSHGGALVDSDVPLRLDAEHHVTVTLDGSHAPARVRVRHVTKLPIGAGPAYLIGLEFVAAGPAVATQIDRWLSAGNGSVDVI